MRGRWRRVAALAGAPTLLWWSLVMAGVTLSDSLLARVELEHGPRAVQTLRMWQHLLDKAAHLPETDKLALVNAFFNRRINFVEDAVHWRNIDYWATPVEFMATGAGDCEDYAIAKYYTLRELGVADDRMRITYVDAVELDQAHMVLAWYAGPGVEPLILDNLVPDIRPASERTDLKPVYSFNGDGLWSARARGQGRRTAAGGRVGRSAELRPWREMGLRFETELAE